MRHLRTLGVGAALSLGALACGDSPSVTDLNNVSSESIFSVPLTPITVQLLITGMLNAERTNDLGKSYIVFSETLARDMYRLDNAENRYITEMLGGPADFSAFTGGGAFAGPYVTIRAGNSILNALPSATGLSPSDLAGTRGAINTIKALAYYRVLETRDSIGIPLDVNHPLEAPPAPYVCKPNALTFISALLDTAITNLNAGGASFPFTMPFETTNGNFNTPAGFAKIAQALKGKVELYRAIDHQKPNGASLTTALNALNASFISPAGGMSTGLYYAFSTAGNETTNPVADANIYLNNAVGDSVQAGDKRASKIVATGSRTLFGVTSKYKSPLTDPAGLALPIAVIKNAELLLLRAQVKIEQGDLAGAAADINAVRTADGGLAPIATPATKSAAISAVLYEKRYSLLGESAHRLVDLRAYSRLNATFLKKELGGDIFQSALPIPKGEFDARNVTSLMPSCP